jgi:hypothetical protein
MVFICAPCLPATGSFPIRKSGLRFGVRATVDGHRYGIVTVGHGCAVRFIIMLNDDKIRSIIANKFHFALFAWKRKAFQDVYNVQRLAPFS